MKLELYERRKKERKDMDKICRVKEMHVVTEIDARTYSLQPQHMSATYISDCHCMAEWHHKTRVSGPSKCP